MEQDGVVTRRARRLNAINDLRCEMRCGGKVMTN